MPKTDAEILELLDTAYEKTLEALQAGDGDQFLLRNKLADISAERDKYLKRIAIAAGTHGPKLNVGIVKRDDD